MLPSNGGVIQDLAKVLRWALVRVDSASLGAYWDPGLPPVGVTVGHVRLSDPHVLVMTASKPIQI